MEVGDRVKVIANTYEDGIHSDHRGKIGRITKLEERGEGYFVHLDESNCRFLFFENQELVKEEGNGS